MATEDLKIQVGDEEVCLDSENLRFNEQTLTDYLQKEGSWYNNFGGKLAKAEYLLQMAELHYESLYAEMFKENKSGKASDKLAEAQTESDPAVQVAKEKVIEAKLNVRLLQQHLRAYDKNHENAQSLGHYLRKEMDKLNSDIMMSSRRSDSFYSSFDDVDKVVGRNNEE